MGSLGISVLMESVVNTVTKNVFVFLLFPLCFCHALVNRQAISRSISHQLHKFHSLHSLTAATVLHLLKPKQKKDMSSVRHVMLRIIDEVIQTEPTSAALILSSLET
jgi:hypothetical protein